MRVNESRKWPSEGITNHCKSSPKMGWIILCQGFIETQVLKSDGSLVFFSQVKDPRTSKEKLLFYWNFQ